MKNKPLISIITSTFNAHKVLERCIESVLAQDYPNIEYIIIDGGSSDNTVSIIQKFAHKVSYWSSEPDSGIYDAWNKGLSRANGDWIGFLGADDVYLPDAISSYVKYINKSFDQNLDFISSKVQLVNEMGEAGRVIGNLWEWDKFKRFMNTAHVGSLHSKNFFDRYGLYNLNFKIVGDYEMLLRANKNLRAGFLDQITAKMQTGGISNLGAGSFNEVLQAKVITNARSPFLARYDFIIARLKFALKKLLFG